MTDTYRFGAGYGTGTYSRVRILSHPSPCDRIYVADLCICRALRPSTALPHRRHLGYRHGRCTERH
ncbi:hypothetical protein GBW32_30395 [Streptomyces tsukubensis]|nr:hypothetical protein GBW32_30395 [Streptomyces tsukubensis]